MQVNNVLDIIENIKNIELGWADNEKNIYYNGDKKLKKRFSLATPEETLEKKIGTNYDIVEVERSYLKNLNIKFNTYFMIYYEPKRVYTHTFIVYEENDKFYWLEGSWNKEIGVHEYLSLYDLITDVKNLFCEYNSIRKMDKDYLCIYKYKKPKAHIGLKEFYKHCENGENVLI